MGILKLKDLLQGFTIRENFKRLRRFRDAPAYNVAQYLSNVFSPPFIICFNPNKCTNFPDPRSTPSGRKVRTEKEKERRITPKTVATTFATHFALGI
jgi:hypothetical protein